MAEPAPEAALGRGYRLKLSSGTSRSYRWIEWITAASAGGGVINLDFCFRILHPHFNRASRHLLSSAVDGMDRPGTSGGQDELQLTNTSGGWHEKRKVRAMVAPDPPTVLRGRFGNLHCVRSPDRAPGKPVVRHLYIHSVGRLAPLWDPPRVGGRGGFVFRWHTPDGSTVLAALCRPPDARTSRSLMHLESLPHFSRLRKLSSAFVQLILCISCLHVDLCGRI